VEGAPSDALISRAKLNFTHYENYAHFILLAAKMVLILLTAKMVRKIELSYG
jgi:hypothetical protein